MDLAKKIIKKRKNEASQNLYLSDIWVRNSVREARENSNIVISNWFSRKWREEFFDMSSSEMLRQTTQVPVHIAENPLMCVALGAGKILEETSRSRPSNWTRLLGIKYS